MIVVAVTGGIGSGKSTVAARLATRGAVVIDADQIARQVVAPGERAFQAIVEHFGPVVVAGDGTLDRSALAARVFSNPAELAALNAITHPAVGAAILTQLADLAGTSGRERPVVLDLPLLTGATRDLFGLAGVVVVDTPIEVAIRRLVEQRGLARADAEARVGAQISREERRLMADVVVDNGGTREQLEASVASLWVWIENLAGPGLDGPGPVESPASVDGPAQETPDADIAEHAEEGE